MGVYAVLLFADGLEALVFLLILEQLAREAGFVASEVVEVAAALHPGAGLGGHDLEAVVMRAVGFVGGEAEAEQVVLDGREAIETEVGVDDFLRYLTLGLGFRLEIDELFCALARLISLMSSFVSDIRFPGRRVAAVLGAGGARIAQMAEGVDEINFFGA